MRLPCSLAATQRPRQHCRLLAHGRYASIPNAGTRCPYHFIALHRLAQRADEFDIIQFHTDYLHVPLFVRHWGKTLTTLHGRLDLPDLPPMLREFATRRNARAQGACSAMSLTVRPSGDQGRAVRRQLYLGARGGGAQPEMALAASLTQSTSI